MARLSFLVAFAFAFVMATLPHPPEVPGNPSDKVLHILTFLVLTVVSSVAWPHSGRVKRLLLLSASGALIEIVQVISALHRDASLLDWLADTGAIIAALVVIRLLRGRVTA